MRGDGVLAPPLVVDAPVVLDGGDRARGQAALTPDRDDAALVVGLDLEWTGRVQRPQVIAADNRRRSKLEVACDQRPAAFGNARPRLDLDGVVERHATVAGAQLARRLGDLG